MNVFEEIAKLNFPAGHYVIVGSGIMAARGIREAHDLDIIVTEKLFEACKREGSWELRPWTRIGRPGKEWLKRGQVDLHIELNSEKGNLSVEDLLRNAELINGVSFITLEQLIEFKKRVRAPERF